MSEALAIGSVLYQFELVRNGTRLTVATPKDA